MELVIHKSKCW